MPLPSSVVVHPRMLDRIRAVHTSAMTGACIVTEPGAGEAVTNDDGTVTFPAGLVRYAGPCRVMPYADGERVVQTQERAVTVRAYRVMLPWAVEPVHIDDTVTPTRSADPDLDGVRLRVIDVQYSTLEAERVLTCEQVVD